MKAMMGFFIVIFIFFLFFVFLGVGEDGKD
jgi:hypothetical protein